MVSDYKITMEQAEYEMVCYRRVFNFVRLLDQEKLEKLNAEGLLAAEGGQTKKADLCIGHFCQGCVAMEAFLRKAELCKLEFIGDDIYQIMAKYLEIDGNPYVMELLKKMDKNSLIDRKDHERLINSLTGYNERLYQDVLTKAYNRRYYEEELKSQMGPAGIAMIDLDDFKLYNDIYGHDMGDQVLCIVADVIKNCIRKTDKLIRYGGDEFLLILSDMVRGTLRGKLLQIQEAIENATIPNCPRLKLTASIGGVISEDGKIDEAIAKADQLMYKAKDHKAQVITECDKTIFKKEKIQNKPRILIVDASEFNRAILKEILEETYEIIEADGGNEALHKIDEYGMKISLVLLDIIMPEKDGFEVLKYMEEERLISDIPVIIISSEDSANYIRRAYEMGVSDYINRPFDANIVYQRVSNTVKLYAKQRRLMAMVTRV